MNTYLVSYDLVAPQMDYSDLYKRIKAYPYWARVLESVWVVKTSTSSKKIRDNLNMAIDNHDKLYIAKLSGEAAWININSNVSGWLEENL
ncbi:hypothetical protein [Paenibacillus sp. JDR-2]|uniref:hypothetical protein n=1 Tax=Paenibacillus sp. (strain JDR-2) TaxID=324057 RepID=UPI000166A26A|nr:hypothetical protein [Paenibacillus sp. JDR-2]ACT00316.1 putative SinR-like protein [Paenibacillus sp. JDR-2]